MNEQQENSPKIQEINSQLSNIYKETLDIDLKNEQHFSNDIQQQQQQLNTIDLELLKNDLSQKKQLPNIQQNQNQINNKIWQSNDIENPIAQNFNLNFSQNNNFNDNKDEENKENQENNQNDVPLNEITLQNQLTDQQINKECNQDLTNNNNNLNQSNLNDNNNESNNNDNNNINNNNDDDDDDENSPANLQIRKERFIKNIKSYMAFLTRKLRFLYFVIALGIGSFLYEISKTGAEIFTHIELLPFLAFLIYDILRITQMNLLKSLSLKYYFKIENSMNENIQQQNNDNNDNNNSKKQPIQNQEDTENKNNLQKQDQNQNQQTNNQQQQQNQQSQKTLNDDNLKQIVTQEFQNQLSLQAKKYSENNNNNDNNIVINDQDQNQFQQKLLDESNNLIDIINKEPYNQLSKMEFVDMEKVDKYIQNTCVAIIQVLTFLLFIYGFSHTIYLITQWGKHEYSKAIFVYILYDSLPAIAFILMLSLFVAGGIVTLAGMAIILPFIPCIKKRRQQEQQNKIKKIKLPKIKYSKEKFSEIEDCSICLEKYKEQEEIVHLKCNEKHIFHEVCIKNWFQSQLKCPLDRQEILLKDYKK